MAKDRYPRSFSTEDPAALSRQLEQLVDALRARDRQGPLNAPLHEWDMLQAVSGQWGVESSLSARPPHGTAWVWDDTLGMWAPRSIGIGAIQPLAAGPNTVALFPLDGDLRNTVDPSNPYTVDAGTAVWTNVVPGKKAFYFDGGTRLRVSAFVSAYAMTGDFSSVQIWQLDTDPTASTVLFGHGAPGDASSTTNILYSATISGGTPPRLMNFLSEHGVGVNDSFTTAAPDSIPPIHNIMLFGVDRIAGVVQFYVNGSTFGAPSAALTTPTDGSAGRLYCGASDGTTLMTRAVCWGHRLDNAPLGAAGHKAVYNATLGQGFGVLS